METSERTTEPTRRPSGADARDSPTFVVARALKVLARLMEAIALAGFQRGEHRDQALSYPVLWRQLPGDLLRLPTRLDTLGAKAHVAFLRNPLSSRI